jgi:glycosyltransferase involved in cell wall biosynthesis
MSLMLSFIIPTYKNENSLFKCVKQIITICTDKKLEYEIIVVDNFESNEFVKVLDTISNKPLCVLKNPQVGAHYSRRLGVYNSKGDIIVLVDDDNYLTAAYVDFIIEKVQNTEGGVFIGCASKEYNSVDWEKLGFNASSYACGSLTTTQFKDNMPVYWGAGSCLTRNLAFDVFRDDLLVEGRMDKVAYVMSGEDHEISLRAYFAKAHFFYYDQIGLYHDFNLKRLNTDYYNKLQIGFGFAAWILKLYYLKNKKRAVASTFYTYYFYNLAMSCAYFVRHPLSYLSRLLINNALDYQAQKKYYTTVAHIVK